MSSWKDKILSIIKGPWRDRMIGIILSLILLSPLAFLFKTVRTKRGSVGNVAKIATNTTNEIRFVPFNDTTIVAENLSTNSATNNNTATNPVVATRIEEAPWFMKPAQSVDEITPDIFYREISLAPRSDVTFLKSLSDMRIVSVWFSGDMGEGKDFLAMKLVGTNWVSASSEGTAKTLRVKTFGKEVRMKFLP